LLYLLAVPITVPFISAYYFTFYQCLLLYLLAVPIALPFISAYYFIF
jgi:hypothetical protein